MIDYGVSELFQEIIDGHANPDYPSYNDCNIHPCMWCVQAQKMIDDVRDLKKESDNA